MDDTAVTTAAERGTDGDAAVAGASAEGPRAPVERSGVAADPAAPVHAVPEPVGDTTADIETDVPDDVDREESPGVATAFEPPLRVSAELKAIVEAVVFASPEPLATPALRKLLGDESPEQLDAAIAALQADYNDQARGLQLIEVAGGYQIVTRPELHEWVRRLFHERTTQKLSVQALETLAVIAYKQPVTAAEIAEIRGVNTSGVLGTLIDRKLIKIAGRKQVVGRPFMYATTREFLDRFGLKDLSELPRVEDMADALGFEPPALAGTAALGLPFDDPNRPREDPPAQGGGAGEGGDVATAPAGSAVAAEPSS